MNQRHTAAATDAAFESAIESFSIPVNYINAMITGSGAKAVRFSRDSRLVQRVSWFAHALQLFIKTFLDKPTSQTFG